MLFVYNFWIFFTLSYDTLTTINMFQRERSLDSQHKFINTIELHGNASSFTVYATVRQCVLFQRIYDISRFYHQATITANCESDEEFKGKFKHIPISLPKVFLFYFSDICILFDINL